MTLEELEKTQKRMDRANVIRHSEVSIKKVIDHINNFQMLEKANENVSGILEKRIIIQDRNKSGITLYTDGTRGQKFVSQILSLYKNYLTLDLMDLQKELKNL